MKSPAIENTSCLDVEGKQVSNNQGMYPSHALQNPPVVIAPPLSSTSIPFAGYAGDH
jgi:hypothetical protein